MKLFVVSAELNSYGDNEEAVILALDQKNALRIAKEKELFVSSQGKVTAREVPLDHTGVVMTRSVSKG